MTNRNRNTNVNANVNANSQEEIPMQSQSEITTTFANVAPAKDEEKLTSFNVTTSVLRILPNGNYKFVLSFRPTVRGAEFWGSMAAAIKSHIAQPSTVERTDDHIIVADKTESDVITHWAIIRSSQRCPICGNPVQTPAEWCHSEFCDAARVATPTEKKSRRVENPNAIDF